MSDEKIAIRLTPTQLQHALDRGWPSEDIGIEIDGRTIVGTRDALYGAARFYDQDGGDDIDAPARARRGLRDAADRIWRHLGFDPSKVRADERTAFIASMRQLMSGASR